MKTMALERRRKYHCKIMIMVVVMLLSGGGGGGVEGMHYDKKYSTIMTAPPSSLFGYSVAFWSYDNYEKQRVVVGAPKSTASDLANGTLHLGAIHVCDISQLKACPDVSDLPKVVTKECGDCSQGLQFEGPEVFQKSTMGLGETIVTGMELLVTCAPRYPVLDIEQKELHGRGACYIMKNENEHTSVFPFNERNIPHSQYINDHNFTAFASFGFSVAINMDNPRTIYAGAPHAFRRQGVMVSSSSSGKKVKAQRQTFKNDPIYDDYLEGWATTRGYFGLRQENSVTKFESLAVSQPGYGNLSGQVIFYDSELTRIPDPTLQAKQLGAWFGYSLVTCNVDDDDYDDLLVGAPLTSRDHPDEGATYLYYAPLKDKGESKPPQMLFGGVPWGRYGTSIACVQSGYDQADVAIGAPGAVGRVYIYNGGADGLHLAQIIHASEFLPSVSASYGFGFSLAGNEDMDGNGLPDLLIGAPTSDAAIFLRRSPWIKLEATVRFDPPEVDIHDKRCEGGPEQTPVIYSELVVNMTLYVAKRDKTRRVDVELEVILDPELQRLAFFNDTSGKRHQRTTEVYTAYKRRRSNNFLRLPVLCKPQLLNDYNYKLPVNVSVRARLKTPPSLSFPPHILDTSHPLVFNSSLILRCKDESLCFSHPDLVLEANGPPHLLIGGDQLHLSVSITCRLNNSAHDIQLNVTFPSDLRYESSNSTHSPHCHLKEEEKEEEEEEEEESEFSRLICDFNRYLMPGEEVRIDLFFSQIAFSQPSGIQSTGELNEPLNFSLSVSSDGSKDINETDNSAIVIVPRLSLVELHSMNSSDPETVEIREGDYLTTLQMVDEVVDDGTTDISVVDLGPVLTHQFAVTNRGPSPLYSFQIEAWFPLNYKGARLLYLVDQPATSGPINCSVDDHFLNPAGFVVPPEDNDLRDTEYKVLNDTSVDDKAEDMRRRTSHRRKREASITTEVPPAGVADEVTDNVLLLKEAPTATEGQEYSSTTSFFSSSSPHPPTPSSSLVPLPPSSSSPVFGYESSSTSFPPPTSSNSFSTSTPSPLFPPFYSQNVGIKKIVINVSKIPSQGIQCTGTNLRPGESAVIKMKTYLVAATLHKLVNLTTQGRNVKRSATFLLRPTFAFNTTQKCVYINNEAKGTHDQDCHSVPHLPAPPHARPRPQNDSLTSTNSTGRNETEADTVAFFEDTLVTYVVAHSTIVWGKELLTILDGWHWIVIVFGGLMLVIATSAILYKAGFFERKTRVTSEMRRESVRKSKINTEPQRPTGSSHVFVL